MSETPTNSRQRQAAPASVGVRFRRAVAALLLSAVVCEGLLQVAARFVPFIRYQIAPPWSRNQISDPDLGYRMSRFFPGHDRLGYRNDDDPDRYDVLAIGDSATYGYGAPPDGSWPRHLRRLIGKPVYNAGVGGYGPCEYRKVMAETLHLQPRVVVLAVSLQNDLFDAYASVYLDHRCTDLATTDPSIMARFRDVDRTGTLRDQANQYQETNPDPGRPNPLKRLALYGLARSFSYQLTASTALPFPGRDEQSYERASQLASRIGMDRPDAFRTVFQDPRLHILGNDLDDVRIAEGLRVLFAAFDEMSRNLMARDTSFVVALLHNKPFVLTSVLTTERPDLWPTFERQVSLEIRMTEQIVKWLSSNNISYVDTGDAMRRAVERGKMPYRETDDHHPSSVGYQIIAEAISEAVHPKLKSSENPGSSR